MSVYASSQMGWYHPAWKYRRKITVDHTKVVNEDQENFPVLIALTDTALKSTIYGGHVAQPRGEDILFTASDGITQLDHEVEVYDPATGTLRAWVSIPTLSHRVDTVVSLYYGNSTGGAGQDRERVWDEHYRMVLHRRTMEDSLEDSTSNRHRGIVRSDKDHNPYVTVEHSESLDITETITVEAWVDGEDPRAEVFQAIVSKWSLLTALDTFDAYDAGHTDGLNTKGFFGAVFDGRYVYFSPQHDGTGRHGKVLRYDTHREFEDGMSWSAYDAGHTSGLNTKGYYGAVATGRYIYFVPRTDGIVHHSRVLRYDTTGDFHDSTSWSAYDAGNPVSYQSAAFDGRYIYFSPGYEEVQIAPGSIGWTRSGKVLRYDTQGDFTDRRSYTTYDAGNTSGLSTKSYDGAVFDGRYVYFAPLEPIGLVLRYDTRGGFTDPQSWTAYDASRTSGQQMGQCVGAVCDGRYVYFVPYANSVIVRYDTSGDFCDGKSWVAYDAGHTSGLKTKGYDGAVYDGRYVYFIPFWEGEDIHTGFHARVLRYDTQEDFTDSRGWRAYDAEGVSGVRAVGFNGGAFDGRCIYFAPWREGTDPDGTILAHGRVLRYDTTGLQASFSLRYADCGHNGGLCAAIPGPSFLVNTDRGVLNVRANRHLEPGLHHIAGVYDGMRILLFVDGVFVNEQEGRGTICENDLDVTIGRIQDGLGYFHGRIFEVRISDTARSAGWIATEYRNWNAPSDFLRVGEEETTMDRPG